LTPELEDIGIGHFSRVVLPDYALREYQIEPARAIVESIALGLGRQFAVVFSRQAGKDEMLAQLLVYLLCRYQHFQRNAILAAPTFRPQAALSRDRLLARLDNPATGKFAGLHDGYVVRVGAASARFLSAAPTPNARGQTADLLLVANEAQDIQPDVWDAVFDPMAASTNATTLFLGTVWSRDTLLARQMRFLEAQQRDDGVQRLWRVPWERVAEDVPAYGERVRARIAQFGINHPFIRTEYCLLELDGDESLFPPHRLAQMQGFHPRRHRAEPGKRYALLIDVAGEEEVSVDPHAFRGDAKRDSTALTVVEIDGAGRREGAEARDNQVTSRLPASAPPRHPIYRVVDRMAWTGVRHATLHDQLVDLARNVWRASVVVVDATGVGAGLASFLAATLDGRRGGKSPIPVVPFIFTATSKSKLGWDFLALIDSGRFKEYADDSVIATPDGRLTAQFWDQLRATTFETPPGPGKLLRWSVPASRGHDDLVISAALTATLDDHDWRPRRAIGHAGYDDFRTTAWEEMTE
jgi:hypothetical protein